MKAWTLRRNTKRLLFVLFTCLQVLQYDAIAQDFQALERYESSLKMYYVQAWVANREEFRDLKQKPLYHYLPDVGFLWGIPNVNFRLHDIFKLKRDRYLLNRKLLALDMKMKLEMNDQLQLLRIRYKQAELKKQRYEGALAMDGLHHKIYLIGKECCGKRECTPEACLKMDLGREQQKQLLLEQKTTLAIEVLELERMAKYDMPSIPLGRN